MGGISKALIPPVTGLSLETILPVTSSCVGPGRGHMGSPAAGGLFGREQRVCLSRSPARPSGPGKRDRGGVGDRTGF